MKVILTEDVANLGKLGDTVEVKKGFARNFLIPRNLAVVASSRNVKTQQHQLQDIERKVAKAVEDAQTMGEKLDGVSVTLTRKAGETGRLFGSVTNMDIADALAEDGITVDRKDIILEDPIRELGDFEVSIKLPHEVSATIKVTVIGEAEEEKVIELSRSSEKVKQSQLARLDAFHKTNSETGPQALERLRRAVLDDVNVFEVLMDVARVCSLGEITEAFFEVGGEYRRNM